MFMQPCVLLQGGAKRALVEDGPKMARLIERVAQFLSEMLVLRNSRGMPLVELARLQVHYLPTHARVKQLSSLLKTYEFVCAAENLADIAGRTAKAYPDFNLRLDTWTNHEAFFCDEDITKSDGIKTSTYNVGGFGVKLMHEVAALAFEWVDDLDRVLSDAVSLERTNAASVDVQLLKEYLALAIAKRLCCICDESVTNDELSTSAIEELIYEELSNASQHANDLVARDVAALQTLRVLASDPRSNASRNALLVNLKALQDLVADAPCELLVHPAAHMLKFDMLGRALVANLDIDVRVALVSFWAESSSAAVISIVDSALEKLSAWKLNTKPLSAIREVPQHKTAPFVLQKPRFVHFNRKYVARTSRNRRAALDERGTRCVRLLNCVLELTVLGVFERGVVASEAVAPVATNAIIVSRIAAQTIINVRDASSFGRDIMEFLNVLYDPSGEYCNAIQRAACSLSSFSVRELATVFDDTAGVLHSVCDAISSQTRRKMTVKVNERYATFATDMLALLLPLVENLRNRCSIPYFARPHAMADMLHTVHKAKSWTPLAGTLRLSMSDLAKAHPNMRATLDALHDKGVLVKRTGGGKNKIVYSFETALLVDLFMRSCAIV